MERREDGVNFDGWSSLDPQYLTSDYGNLNEELGHEYDGVLGQDDRSAFEDLGYDDSGEKFAFDINEGSDYEFDGPRVPTEQNDDREEERKEIENRIDKFKNDCKKIREHLEAIKASITLGTETDYAVSAIRQLDSELRVLDEFTQELIGRIDEFKSKYENADFSISYKEMVNELQSIKDDLRTVKRLQIENYNYTVEATNQAIENLRAYNNSEINEFLDSLPALEICNANIRAWNSKIDYLNDMNYEVLRDVNRRLTEFMVNRLNDILNTAKDNRITQDLPGGNDPGANPVDPNGAPVTPDGESGANDDSKKNDPNDKSTWSMITWDLYNRIVDIEAKLAELKEAIEKATTLEEINRLRSEYTTLSSKIIDFNARLDAYKNEIGEEVYNELFERDEYAYEDLYELDTLLNEKGSKLAEENGKVFNELKRRVEFLTHEKDYLKLTVNSLYSKTNEVTVEELLKHVNNLVNRLGEIEKDAKDALDAGKIDNNQYEQLMNNVQVLKPELEEISNKLKDPGMFKNADIYSVLNGDIDGIELAIDMLDKDVESREKPIKRPERKELDQKFKVIEKEIKRLEKTLEQYKDKDPEKYNATMDRLKAAKEKLEKVGKKYRSKCPLLVRAVKSAKALFKKYKKQILIAAGIIAFALVAHHVLIPAIMHGNEMIALSAARKGISAMTDFANFSNNILGGIINAKRTTEGFWFLANGVRINPLSSASSLLKGLAISGISSAALLGPQVVAVKKLVDKMKTVDLKKKLSEQKEKSETERNKRRDKTRNSNKKADKESLEKIKALLLEYRKSGKTFEEFAAEKELSEEELTILKYLVENSEEYKKEHASSSGRKGGR